MASPFGDFFSGLADFFNPGKSPDGKAARNGGEKEQSDSSSGSAGSKRPLTAGRQDKPATENWVLDGVGGALTHFGQKVEERVIKAEEKASKEVQETKAEVDARMTEMENKLLAKIFELETQLGKQKQVIDKLEEEFKHVRESTAHQTAATAAHAPCGLGPIPFEQRTQATIGCLGWDTDPGTLLLRGTEVLDQCGYKMQVHYTAISCPRRAGGSICHVQFKSAFVLQEAKIKVRALAKIYVEDKTVWLDASKTREELAPNRYLHRMTTHLTALQSIKSNPEDVVKHVPTKTISVGGVSVGYASTAGWHWLPRSTEKVPLEQQQQAAAYATSF